MSLRARQKLVRYFRIMQSHNVQSQLKVTPRIWIGIAIWLGYIATVFVVQQLSGVKYTELGDNGANLFFGAGLSLIVGTILLAITTTLLGWWRPALFEATASRHKWPIIAPVLMAVALVFNLAGTDWGSFDGAFFAASVVLLLVGFTEELTTRGLLVVALRSRLSEVWVWLFSTLAFALMHYINVFGGQGFVPTTQQVLFAFLAGTIFYILRRVTGSLIWAMVLHALWDFSVFSVGHGAPSTISALANPLFLAAAALAIVAVWFVVRTPKALA